MCAEVPTIEVMKVSLGKDGGKDIHDFLKMHGRDAFKQLLDHPLSAMQATAKEIGERILAQKDKFPPMGLDEVLKPLGLTIKKDDVNKSITFLCAISTYSKEDQFNLSYNGPSSTGKSFIPLEISALLPAGDVLIISYSSAKAFFHDYTYVREDGAFVVDLSQKLLIFLDQPHTRLLEHLRPLLSHDRKEITLKITDKNKSGMRTKTIVLIGYPSVMFCSANLRLDEQEATRFLLLSPEISEEKIRAAIQQKIRKESDRLAYFAALENDPARKRLKERIQAIKDAAINEVKIKDPKVIEDRFLVGKDRLKPRYSRDVGRIINLIKASALLNLWHREVDGDDIYANDEDIDNGFKLWQEISKSQELNLPKYVYDLFVEVMEPLLEVWPGGITKQAVIKEHLLKYGRPLEEWRLRREILPMLEMAGLIVQSDDPNDKRRKLIHNPYYDPGDHGYVPQ